MRLIPSFVVDNSTFSVLRSLHLNSLRSHNGAVATSLLQLSQHCLLVSRSLLFLCVARCTTSSPKDVVVLCTICRADQHSAFFSLTRSSMNARGSDGGTSMTVKRTVSVTVNGQRYQTEVEPRLLLV